MFKPPTSIPGINLKINRQKRLLLPYWWKMNNPSSLIGVQQGVFLSLLLFLFITINSPFVYSFSSPSSTSSASLHKHNLSSRRRLQGGHNIISPSLPLLLPHSSAPPTTCLYSLPFSLFGIKTTTTTKTKNSGNSKIKTLKDLIKKVSIFSPK